MFEARKIEIIVDSLTGFRQCHSTHRRYKVAVGAMEQNAKPAALRTTKPLPLDRSRSPGDLCFGPENAGGSASEPIGLRPGSLATPPSALPQRPSGTAPAAGRGAMRSGPRCRCRPGALPVGSQRLHQLAAQGEYDTTPGKPNAGNVAGVSLFSTVVVPTDLRG
jgi:hypothetical protein